jgi:hypothetical protein
MEFFLWIFLPFSKEAINHEERRHMRNRRSSHDQRLEAEFLNRAQRAE